MACNDEKNEMERILNLNVKLLIKLLLIKYKL